MAKKSRRRKTATEAKKSTSELKLVAEEDVIYPEMEVKATEIGM